MSYILDALRKADQERAAGAVPDLESAHERLPPGQRTYRWAWILVVLLALNGALMVLLATRDTGTGGMQTADGPIAGPARETAGSLRPPARPAVPADSAVAAVVPVPKTVLHQDRPAAAAPARPAVTTTAPARKPVASAAVKPATPGKARPTAATAPVLAPPAVQADTGLKDWEDLSIEFRSTMELPRMDVHVYDADPQRRFVLIDLRKYRAGDRLENGVVIEEILPDGIQLSYQGTRFRYRK
jgi:general secretion pathway protein B